jgi:hypothetical protein
MDEKVLDLSENGGYHQMTPPNGKYDVENHNKPKKNVHYVQTYPAGS